MARPLPPDVGQLLSLAEDLLDHEPERAMGALLEAYQATFHPRVAELVERLSALHQRPLEGLPTKQADRGAALAAGLQGSALARGAVLETIGAFAQSAQGKKVRPALEPLLDLDPDPRVARTSLTVLTTGQVRDLTGKVLRRLVTSFERHAHQGALADFERWLPSGVQLPGMSARLPNVAARLRKREPVAVPEQVVVRLLSRLPAPLAPSRPEPSPVSEAEMLAAIAAAVDDDAPRLMYADWLTEHLDPRGEFIALQVARTHGRPSQEARRREDELFQQYRVRLLGPLAACVALSGLRFERGFPARVSLKADLPRHPFIRLLTDVEFFHHSAPRDLPLDSLVTARSVSLEVLAELMGRAPRLHEATTRLWGRKVPEWTMCRELVSRLPRPLSRFEVDMARETEPFDFILRDALTLVPLREVAELSIVHGAARTFPSRATLERVPKTLRRLALHRHQPTVGVVLEREGDAWLHHVQVHLGWAEDGSHLWPWVKELGVKSVDIRALNPKRVQPTLQALDGLEVTLK